MLVDVSTLVSVKTYQKLAAKRLSRTAIYRQIEEGAVESVKIDGTVFIVFPRTSRKP